MLNKIIIKKELYMSDKEVMTLEIHGYIQKEKYEKSKNSDYKYTCLFLLKNLLELSDSSSVHYKFFLDWYNQKTKELEKLDEKPCYLSKC
jgi:hypothetical protein